MTDHSRRSFLKHASIGAAAAGAIAVVPTVTNAADAAPAAPEAKRGPTHDGPFTVWVNDSRSGEIAVLVGEHEVVHHDPELARSLARIAARGAQS